MVSLLSQQTSLNEFSLPACLEMSGSAAGDRTIPKEMGEVYREGRKWMGESWIAVQDVNSPKY